MSPPPRAVTPHLGFVSVKLSQSLLLNGEMSKKEVQLDQEAFSCAICFDLLKDPVTTSCGHSFCMSCVQSHWDREEEKQLYSCPQCRQSFTPRPVLMKNTMLADLVEQLKKSGIQDTPADHCSVGPGDVVCDVCTGRKMKAVKSCLQCLASYCETHLQPHCQSAALGKHQLTEPSEKLQENICRQHNEVKKMFCRDDQQCICVVCCMDQHKGHHTVSAAAERAQRQTELKARRDQVLHRIRDKETDLEKILQEAVVIECSADEAVRHSEESFTRLNHLLEKRRSEVEQQIRTQQETEEARVRQLQAKLQQDITELRRTQAQLDSLCLTPDHNQFLHNYPPLSSAEAPDSSRIQTPTLGPLNPFEQVTAAVSALTDQLQLTLRDSLENLSLALSQDQHLLPQPEPTTRKDFLKYSREITLDPNTAHTQLSLSEGNRQATLVRENQSYPDHPDRFSNWQQVLSQEGLTGRCYWEVKWSGTGVDIAVAYKNIKRKGLSVKCGFGKNDKSWALFCHKNGYLFRFNKVQSAGSSPVSSRIGVYLDHSAGILSFYSVSKSMTLLHRVQTTFTQPLLAGVGFCCFEDTAIFPKLK